MFNIPSESHLLSRKDCVVDSFDPLIDSWTRFRSHQIPIKGDRILLTSDGTRQAKLIQNVRYYNNISLLDMPTWQSALIVRYITSIVVTL